MSISNLTRNEDSPLNFAVSLGLHTIVGILLDRGARHDHTSIFACVDRNLMFRNFKFPMFNYLQKFDHEKDVNH